MKSHKNIPKALRKIKHWSIWHFQVVDGVEKKPPYSKNGKPIRLNFKKALKLLKEKDYAGLSFDFKNTPYSYIDLDTRKDEADRPFHNKLVNEAKKFTYTETSQSGDGSHIAYIGNQLEDQPAIESRDSNLLYLTGDMIGSIKTIAPLTPEFLRLYGKGVKSGTRTIVEYDRDSGPLTDADSAVISKLLSDGEGSKYKGGEWFERVYKDGDIREYNDDHSRADIGLLNAIATRCGEDYKQVDRIFRSSALDRPKWNKDDYYNRTMSHVYSSIHERIEKTFVHIPKDNPMSAFDGFKLTDEYLNGLGKEEFLYDNLIVKHHTLIICAEPGTGKTSFMLSVVCPEMTRRGQQVTFFDADSPPSDHKYMQALADKGGFALRNTDANNQGIKAIIEILEQMVADRQDLTDNVLVFDTMKKFMDMMSKTDSKVFFILLRALSVLGATLVLLAHTKKYRADDNTLIIDGVGDPKNDCSALIYLDTCIVPGSDRDIQTVSTVVDRELGAKFKGIVRPFSFTIHKKTRDVELLEDYVIPQCGGKAEERISQNDILDKFVEVIEREGPIKASDLRGRVHALTGVGENRIGKVFRNNTARAGGKSAKVLRYEHEGKSIKMFYPTGKTDGPGE